MTLGKMTGSNKLTNPLHFGNDPADIRTGIWINPEMWIQILITWLRLDAFLSVITVKFVD